MVSAEFLALLAVLFSVLCGWLDWPAQAAWNVVGMLVVVEMAILEARMFNYVSPGSWPSVTSEHAS